MRQTHLVTPEILEPRWAQLRVPHRMLDVLMAEIGLQRAGIVALVCEGITAGVAQHVWVDALELGRFPGPRDHLRKACCGERRAAFGGEHKWRSRCSLELTQRPHFIAW